MSVEPEVEAQLSAKTPASAAAPGSEVQQPFPFGIPHWCDVPISKFLQLRSWLSSGKEFTTMDGIPSNITVERDPLEPSVKDKSDAWVDGLRRFIEKVLAPAAKVKQAPAQFPLLVTREAHQELWTAWNAKTTADAKYIKFSLNNLFYCISFEGVLLLGYLLDCVAVSVSLTRDIEWFGTACNSSTQIADFVQAISPLTLNTKLPNNGPTCSMVLTLFQNKPVAPELLKFFAVDSTDGRLSEEERLKLIRIIFTINTDPATDPTHATTTTTSTTTSTMATPTHHTGPSPSHITVSNQMSKQGAVDPKQRQRRVRKSGEMLDDGAPSTPSSSTTTTTTMTTSTPTDKTPRASASAIAKVLESIGQPKQTPGGGDNNNNNNLDMSRQSEVSASGDVSVDVIRGPESESDSEDDDENDQQRQQVDNGQRYIFDFPPLQENQTPEQYFGLAFAKARQEGWKISIHHSKINPKTKEKVTIEMRCSCGGLPVTRQTPTKRRKPQSRRCNCPLKAIVSKKGLQVICNEHNHPPRLHAAGAVVVDASDTTAEEATYLRDMYRRGWSRARVKKEALEFIAKRLGIEKQLEPSHDFLRNLLRVQPVETHPPITNIPPPQLLTVATMTPRAAMDILTSFGVGDDEMEMDGDLDAVYVRRSHALVERITALATIIKQATHPLQLELLQDMELLMEKYRHHALVIGLLDATEANEATEGDKHQ